MPLNPADLLTRAPCDDASGGGQPGSSPPRAIVPREIRVARLLPSLVEQAKALMRARSAMVLLPDQGELVVAARTDDRGARGRPTRTGGGAEAAHDHVLSLRVDDRVIGLLIVVGPAPGADPAEAEEFAAAAAGALDIALRVEQELARHGAETAEQVRRRWARELHDETLQSLGLIAAALRERSHGSGDSAEPATIEWALGQIDEEIERLRVLLADLRPLALDELGLKPALEVLIGRITATRGVAVDLDVEVGALSDDRASDLETTLYRLAQEAVHNTLRHADATRIEIAIRRRDAHVALTVRDDGAGFPVADTPEGLGIIGMRERVQSHGGRLRISSEPGQGTRVEALVPFSDPDHAGDHPGVTVPT